MFWAFFKPIIKRHCVPIRQLFKSAAYGVSARAMLEEHSSNTTHTLTPFRADLDHWRNCTQCLLKIGLTLSQLMYIYGAPCKARKFNVVYIYGPTFGNAESRLSLFAAQCFKHWINAESFPVSQLWVNTLPATKTKLELVRQTRIRELLKNW
jgi:hypothetical protein